MKILIIGGNRFFGYHIAKRLVAGGHEVALFNRGLASDDFGGAVRRIHGDRLDRRDFFAKLSREKFDVVIDMIAFTADDSQSDVETFAGRVGHFIHISTGSVYIVTRDFPCPLHEEDFNREVLPQPKMDEGWWLYGYHKRKCEEVLDEAYRQRAFPVTMLRLPIVMGERDYTLRAYSYFLRLEDGRPLILPDSGFNVFTHIYQGDVVRLVASNLLNSSAFGKAYNLAQAEILTLRGFVQAAARILNRQPELVEIPTDVLEASSLGTSFSPLSTRRPFVMSTDRARQELGFASTPFEAWLEKTIRWFRDEYAGDPPENYSSREREASFAAAYQNAVSGLRAKQTT